MRAGEIKCEKSAAGISFDRRARLRVAYWRNLKVARLYTSAGMCVQVPPVEMEKKMLLARKINTRARLFENKRALSVCANGETSHSRSSIVCICKAGKN